MDIKGFLSWLYNLEDNYLKHADEQTLDTLHLMQDYFEKEISNDYLYKRKDRH